MNEAKVIALPDATDRALIVATQGGLPLVAEPYHALAEQLGISAEEVMQRLQAMQQNGIIRRIGLVPNHYALGYTFNGMTVWNVPDERIHILGPQLGALPFVSHCYRRPRYLPEWPYNLFAMVHGRTREETDAQVEEIASLLGDDDRGHAVLYSTRILKKTGLRLGSRGE
jgi:DNA-binding Lrp family transcriptional regulator